jgi:hypothetical protein
MVRIDVDVLVAIEGAPQIEEVVLGCREVRQ